MSCFAKLSMESKDASSISKSISADNEADGKLKVETTAKGGMVISKISSPSISTVLSTIDDILRCQMTSESVI